MRLAYTDSGLHDPTVAAALDSLHAAAKRDRRVFASLLPRVLFGALRGRSAFESAQPHLKNAFIPVSREHGAFMYAVARAARARLIVEFGSSFGISTIYLAAAARANGGRVIGTEIEPVKIAGARRNIADAGLSAFADIREGDALESLAPLQGPIDFLFLDGWKTLYLPVLKMLEPQLAPNAIVMADNIRTFRKSLAPFVDYVRDPANLYETTILPFESGVTFSIWRGAVSS